MTKCKKCNHDCHCNGDLHADEYGLCVCENCQCKREYKKEKDEHLQLHEDVPEPDVPVMVEEKIKCNTHLRFKKSCPTCVEVANG